MACGLSTTVPNETFDSNDNNRVFKSDHKYVIASKKLTNDTFLYWQISLIDEDKYMKF